MNEKSVSKSEAARILGVSPQRVYELVKNGKLETGPLVVTGVLLSSVLKRLNSLPTKPKKA